MRYLIRYSFMSLLLLAATNSRLAGQSPADSLSQYLGLIDELVKAENFEQAQIEAVSLQMLLDRWQLPWPAQAVRLLSEIYAHNEDEDSAVRFLTAASASAGHEQNLESRLRLLDALTTAFNRWDLPEKSLEMRQQMFTAKDSLAEQEHRAALLAVRQEMDSLSYLRQREIREQRRYVRLETNKALLAAAVTALAFLALVLANRRAAARWRKRLAKKELELEFLRSDRFTSTLPETPAAVEQTAAIAEPFTQQGFYPPVGNRPDKTALLIEPNRQIVLYLKSLLSDRFEVETAGTASEGLQVATNHMPDLIVCDAVLNGQTGIELVRKIKLSDRTNHIPIILLTERFGNEGKLDALRAGADAWFSRPVLDNEFDDQVRRLLDARKTNHEQFARFIHLYFSENRIPVNDPFLAQTVQLIDQYLGDPDFMADDLARKMQLHKQHYFKKLQALTGKEPIQLIREMRLEKAKALLEKRAGTPQAIAELVGFSSTGTFALAFKEYFGENTSLLQMPNK